jgi:hypothetical protein
MTQNGPKWTKINHNGAKEPELAQKRQNGPNRAKMVQNGTIFVQKGPKWLGMILIV